MNQKIKDREMDKRYLAIVEGTPKPPRGSLKGYLFKDAKLWASLVTQMVKNLLATQETRV